MNKLFSFSKIASIATIVLLVFYVIFSFLRNYYPGYDEYYLFRENSGLVLPMYILKIIINVLLTIFFFLIYKHSVPGSSLRKPALLGNIMLIISVISFIFSIIIFTSGSYKETGWENFSYTLYYYRRLNPYLQGIYPIGLLVSFIFLIKYFNNKLLKVLALIYPISLILIFVTDWSNFFFYYENPIMFDILGGLGIFALACFYYVFSKMSNNK